MATHLVNAWATANHLAFGRRNTCEVCGGQLELAGPGVIRCPYCGTEYFLE